MMQDLQRSAVKFFKVVITMDRKVLHNSPFQIDKQKTSGMGGFSLCKDYPSPTLDWRPYAQ